MRELFWGPVPRYHDDYWQGVWSEGDRLYCALITPQRTLLTIVVPGQPRSPSGGLDAYIVRRGLEELGLDIDTYRILKISSRARVEPAWLRSRPEVLFVAMQV